MDRMQIQRATLPIGLLLVIFLFVHACVPKPITDLGLVGVTRLPASALPLSDDMRETLTQRGEHVWKVSLAGDANWIREVRRHELNSYAKVVRCDQRDFRVLSLGPYVGQVRVTYYGDGFRGYRATSHTAQYDIYLPETFRYRSEADFNAPMPTYDLARVRLPLCIRIAGGAMHGAYNRSNEVRVDVGKVP